ncbi:hypothetical protein [Microcoleus sp. bin38.metabat.b11b12b14.051]|uniref:hypothetical protein n=1 Tax=Microcoleus sp. bin38.metabat.b11b12b14.051 TaxID=2742709 RepID=UPI0025F06117|nr:hypothetical protein [Microcoleus sp. bin38.metabat.b11b12b14.051]
MFDPCRIGFVAALYACYRTGLLTWEAFSLPRAGRIPIGLAIEPQGCLAIGLACQQRTSPQRGASQVDRKQFLQQVQLQLCINRTCLIDRT